MTTSTDMIHFKQTIPADCKKIVVAMHGFGSSKESNFISRFEEKIVPEGIGLIKFDWPGHGEDNSSLSLNRCLLYLETIINTAKNDNPSAKTIAFGTSFGGYLTLLFNYLNPVMFDQIILRSPAIKMDKILLERILKEEKLSALNNKGCCTTCFDKPIEITLEFIKELQENKLFDLYGNKNLPIVSIMHGTVDELVPFEDSKEFSKIHGCVLYPIENADHRYLNSGNLEEAIRLSKRLINNM